MPVPGQPHLLRLSGVGCQASLNCQLAVVSGHLRGQGSQLVRTRHRFGDLGLQKHSKPHHKRTHVFISQVSVPRYAILRMKIQKYSIIPLFLYQADTFLMRISISTPMTSWLKLFHV